MLLGPLSGVCSRGLPTGITPAQALDSFLELRANVAIGYVLAIRLSATHTKGFHHGSYQDFGSFSSRGV
ncbi:hypothetical protein SEA_OCTOBIEN14_146 [Gordonia phage Octobien14]|uniref:Uncharacterized protein n=1 Tax=Gordonia phage Octobien14 TaxID=2483673 RepID=A0A3G3MAL0_9CAUD|nr:hypothetical protein L3Y22_gp098 [Gordonia phage Octobien14]AYR03289.1 hypothetical protein SEA_OCTOBIEN14_146 [Gordonia phage Octobien14]